jgi:hypothetical protein
VSSRVRIKTRRCSDAAAFRGQLEETVILRDEEVVAVLPEGDPLRHGLELSAEDLRLLRVNLRPVVEARPRVKEVLEALIEYKEGQDQRKEGPRNER